MRHFWIVFFLAAGSTRSRAELLIQKDSISPDRACAFAIVYPPAPAHEKGWLQACFVHPETKEKIGNAFYLEEIDAGTYAPGSYVWNYNNFDFVWSADSTHVAVKHNLRHFGRLFPFRRAKSTFMRLEMPELPAMLDSFLKDVTVESIHTHLEAIRWLPKHRLLAHVDRDAQVTNDEKDWKKFSLEVNLTFDAKGRGTVLQSIFSLRNDVGDIADDLPPPEGAVKPGEEPNRSTSPDGRYTVTAAPMEWLSARHPDGEPFNVSFTLKDQADAILWTAGAFSAGMDFVRPVLWSRDSRSFLIFPSVPRVGESLILVHIGAKIESRRLDFNPLIQKTLKESGDLKETVLTKSWFEDFGLDDAGLARGELVLAKSREHRIQLTIDFDTGKFSVEKVTHYK